MLATVLFFWFFCMHKFFEKALRGLDLSLIVEEKKSTILHTVAFGSWTGEMEKKRWLTSLICDSGAK